MKQSIITLATALALTMASTIASAQTVSFKSILKQASDSNINAVLDKGNDRITIKNINGQETASTGTSITVNAKALKDFSKKFKGITNEFWETTAEGGLSASFNKENARTTIYYDRKGNWQAYIKSFGEEQLPAKIRQALKDDYYNATVNYAHEILTTASEGGPTYLIQLEDKKYLIELRYNEGNLEVWKRYEKQL